MKTWDVVNPLEMVNNPKEKDDGGEEEEEEEEFISRVNWRSVPVFPQSPPPPPPPPPTPCFPGANHKRG